MTWLFYFPSKSAPVYDLQNTPAHTGDFSGISSFSYDQSGSIIEQLMDSDFQDLEWSPYGKVDKVIDKGTSTPITEFDYSPSQNRIRKKHFTGQDLFYVRDAQGNIMAVYELDGTDVIWKEQYLYGSSQLGLCSSPNKSDHKLRQ